MLRLVKNEILPQLDFTNVDICVDHIKGKQTKLIVKKLATRSTELLKLIHINICVPLVFHLGVEKSTTLPL